MSEEIKTQVVEGILSKISSHRKLFDYEVEKYFLKNKVYLHVDKNTPFEGDYTFSFSDNPNKVDEKYILNYDEEEKQVIVFECNKSDFQSKGNKIKNEGFSIFESIKWFLMKINS